MLRPDEYYIQQTRLADLRRVADEVDATANQRKEQNRESNPPAYGPLLAQLGEMMVNIGSNLKARYGEMVEEAQHVADATATPKNSPAS